MRTLEFLKIRYVPTRNFKFYSKNTYMLLFMLSRYKYFKKWNNLKPNGTFDFIS